MIRYWAILTYVIFIAISAHITFDLNLPNVTVPVSGQTLAILTGAIFLKPLESLVGILLYCLLGIIGLPIFADGGSGWDQFIGGSFGYFVGFGLSAYASSQLIERGWGHSIFKLFIVMLIGTLIILGCGTLWLSKEYGLVKAIEYGFTPFVSGGLVKMVLGVLLVKVIQYVLSFFKR